MIGYDTIYAHQDKEDDALVGVRSTARLFGAATARWLVGLYGGALVLFCRRLRNGRRCRPLAYVGLAAAAVHMAYQISRLDIDDPDQCLKLFQSNKVLGWLIFGGLLAGGAWAALSA